MLAFIALKLEAAVTHVIEVDSDCRQWSQRAKGFWGDVTCSGIECVHVLGGECGTNPL